MASGSLALGSIVRRVTRGVAAAVIAGSAKLHTGIARTARKVSTHLARLPRAAELGARWTIGLMVWPLRATGLFLVAAAAAASRGLTGAVRLTALVLRWMAATILNGCAAAARALFSTVRVAARALIATARALLLSFQAGGQALLACLAGIVRLIAGLFGIALWIAHWIALAGQKFAATLVRTLARAGRYLQACAQRISGAVVRAVHQAKVALAEMLRLAVGLVPSRQAMARAGLAAYSALALVAVLALTRYGLERPPEPAPAPAAIEPAEPQIAALPAPTPTEIPAEFAVVEEPAKQPRTIDWRHDVGDPSDDVAATERKESPAPTKTTAIPTQPVARIAVVIDDLGLNKKLTQRVIGVDGPLTLAFLPYANSLRTQTARARHRGHELLVHLPMEPKAAATDPGPNAMRTGLPAREFERRLKWNLSRFSGFVGFNNHMGSRLSEDYDSMGRLLAEAKARGLLYLDSRTTAATVARPIAQAIDLPFAERDVFLDNIRTTAAIERRFDELEATAKANGQAIAIGHPYRATIAVLKRRIPQLEEKGIALVPLSALAKSPVQRVAEAPGSSSAFEGQ